MMIVWECLKCKHRYGQVVNQPVSSCPRCKSEDRARLIESPKELESLTPDMYFDLWRIASGGPELFVAILGFANASSLATCPECSGTSFLHMGDCSIAKLISVEYKANADGLNPGGYFEWQCMICRGKIETFTCHYGRLPSTIDCKASIGCKGGMSMTRELSLNNVDLNKIKWRFVRPADLASVSVEERLAAFENGMLILMRAEKIHPELK